MRREERERKRHRYLTDREREKKERQTHWLTKKEREEGGVSFLFSVLQGLRYFVINRVKSNPTHPPTPPQSFVHII